jgi:hypothetical protein
MPKAETGNIAGRTLVTRKGSNYVSEGNGEAVVLPAL